MSAALDQSAVNNSSDPCVLSLYTAGAGEVLIATVFYAGSATTMGVPTTPGLTWTKYGVYHDTNTGTYTNIFWTYAASQLINAPTTFTIPSGSPLLGYEICVQAFNNLNNTAPIEALNFNMSSGTSVTGSVTTASNNALVNMVGYSGHVGATATAGTGYTIDGQGFLPYATFGGCMALQHANAVTPTSGTTVTPVMNFSGAQNTGAVTMSLAASGGTAAIDQTQYQLYGQSNGVSLFSTTNSGDIVICCINFSSNSSIVSVPAPTSPGLTWTKKGDYFGNSIDAQTSIYWTLASGIQSNTPVYFQIGGTSLEVPWSTNIFSLTGANNTTPIEAVNLVNQSSVSTTGTGSVTTASNNALVAMIGCCGNAISAAGTGYSSIGLSGVTGLYTLGEIATSLTASSGTTVTPTMTSGSSAAWVLTAISFAGQAVSPYNSNLPILGCG